MRIKCLFGRHLWDGCKCSECGKTRDEEHDWSSDCQKCVRCKMTREIAHEWDGCKCTGCGKTRDEEHDWSSNCQECTRCLKVRNVAHEWEGCKCCRCEETRDGGHTWDGCKCSRCGETRDEGHLWDGCYCSRCERPLDEGHNWAKCKCSRCGETRDEEHEWEWLDRRCSNCGRIYDEYQVDLLTKNLKEAQSEFARYSTLPEALEIASETGLGKMLCTPGETEARETFLKLYRKLAVLKRRLGPFETGEKNPQRILCSDNDCPCSGTESLVAGSAAYLYISQQVVDFREDCLTLMERDAKLEQMAREMGVNAITVDGGVANPFYLCEIGVKRRGLDLAVALADAATVAQTGFAPLRPTPRQTTRMNQGLFDAARKGDAETVSKLLAEGADKNVKDGQDLTLLHWAANNGHQSVVQVLLQARAEVDPKDKRGLTPLYWAARKGHASVVEALLQAGADKNVKDEQGVTPLHWAANDGHESAVEVLLRAGADKEAKDKL